jgi:hypothetical protein
LARTIAGNRPSSRPSSSFFLASSPKTKQFFRDHITDLAHAVELTGEFDRLSPTDLKQAAVRGRTTDDRWIVKKKFWCESDEAGAPVWKEQYFTFCGEETLEGWPENDGAWANFPPEYQSIIAELPGRGPRPNNSTRALLRETVKLRLPHLVGETAADWIPNPGGGGNWKSNANSTLPRYILVKAVHDAADEVISKEGSSYGQIVTLILEKSLMQRAEVRALRDQIKSVLKLFSPDPEHPEVQAAEIREIETRINSRLNEVIGGIVSIRTSERDIEPVILPSTHLVLRDKPECVETAPGHQGHGLQRVLIMTLLQILAEVQSEPQGTQQEAGEGDGPARSVILAVEEPELYMHPQMERKMRDVLYSLAGHDDFQVICTTHSPVFLTFEKPQKTIVRVVKDARRRVSFFQVSEAIYADDTQERERLRLIAEFNPAVNEVFFAPRVVLFEELSAIVAFQRAAELLGLFERHPYLRRDVTLINCEGKRSIPLFQKVLNHFAIPYFVIHDEDSENPAEARPNDTIAAVLASANAPPTWRHMISPQALENMLGYNPGKDKPYRAMKRVEELYEAHAFPAEFLIALNWAYFGQDAEPST